MRRQHTPRHPTPRTHQPRRRPSAVQFVADLLRRVRTLRVRHRDGAGEPEMPAVEGHRARVPDRLQRAYGLRLRTEETNPATAQRLTALAFRHATPRAPRLVGFHRPLPAPFEDGAAVADGLRFTLLGAALGAARGGVPDVRLVVARAGPGLSPVEVAHDATAARW